MNGTVQRILQGVQERENGFYRFWMNWQDPNDVGRMAPPWKDPDLLSCCTSLYNDIFGEMRDEGYPVAPIGGTGYWNSALVVWEQPVLAKNYPPGFFGVTPYTDDYNQGHVQMVATAAEPAGGGWGDQYIAQSDHSQGVTADGLWGYPGAHTGATMSWTWNNIDWPTWIGLVPGVPVLDGFPGYAASAYEIVGWYTDLCKWWNGMPLMIPMACIAAELSTVIDPNRTGSIWDLPGYSTPVDHTSYGQHQQLAEYYPCPWNFETAAWSFMARVDAVLGTDAYPNGDDPVAVGELCQEVQQSAYPDAYEKNYEWAKSVVDAAAKDEPSPDGWPTEKVKADEQAWIRTEDDKYVRAEKLAGSTAGFDESGWVYLTTKRGKT